jgi:antitoxin MazE
MIKTLAKHGNSYAIVIDKPIMDLLNIAPDTQLEMVTDGRSLVLTPARKAITDEELQAAIAAVDAQYRTAFQNLAK